MCLGVGKCGSPAPKSINWTPCARNFAASAATAIVAETSIRPIRSANTLRSKETEVAISSSIFTDFLGKAQPAAGGTHFETFRYTFAQSPIATDLTNRPKYGKNGSHID